MILKKKLSKKSGLYAILDREILGKEEILDVAKKVIRGGADIIQLRDKKSPTDEAIETASAIKAIAKKYGVPFVINDRIDVALAVNADGLHIGQGDINIGLAKKIMGKGSILGVSAGNIKQARFAKDAGADYLGAGPIFKTPVKKHKWPRGLKLLEDMRPLDIPVFAIGGINLNNIKRLIKKGFKNVAVIRVICNSENPFLSTKRLKEALA